MSRRRLIFLALSSALLGACASAPKPLQGEFSSVLPSDAGSEGRIGDRVRWGGEIVAVDTQATRSCFELLGKPLTDSARPQRADETAGRFIACREGFYDPALFEVGRELTVTGTIEAIEPRPIGGFEYRYPRLAADVIYLWPSRDPMRMRPVGYWVGQHGNAWVSYWTPIWLPPY
jgi:outer membrane lipoprotein